MAKNITNIIDSFKYPPEVTTREWLGRDYCYRTLMQSFDDAIRYNYHSDYWGSASDYQELNIYLVQELEPWVGERCVVDYGGGDRIEGTLEGILVDDQYNDISHTCVLFSDVKEGDGR